MRIATVALLLCSLGMGALICLVSLPLLSSGEPALGNFQGYAAIALDDSVPDREAALSLEQSLGRPVIAESSQWVFLDSFGSLERLSLEEYENRLEPFDPRRDGYAEKLKNFFTRDGKRWFFIPLDREMVGRAWNPARSLEKKIATALEGFGIPALTETGVRPFDLELKLTQGSRPLGAYLLLFAAAFAAALFLAGSRQSHGQGSRTLILLSGPLTLPLSLWGAPGFALLALLFLLGALLMEPARELWLAAGKRPGFGIRKAPRVSTLGPYRYRLMFGIPLALLLAGISWVGGVAVSCALLSVLSMGALYSAFWGIETRRRRFVPVPILPTRRQALPRPASMLPFALASCLALALSPLTPASSVPGDWPFLVGEEDYRAHARFQSGFSHRSLFSQDGTGYLRYVVGEDGLVAGVEPAADDPVSGILSGEAGIPPFPLADLSAFLAGEAVPAEAEPASPRVPAFLSRELVSPLLALLLALPAFFTRGRGRGGWKKSPAYDDKRIAA
jgi:hypothetical protein